MIEFAVEERACREEGWRSQPASSGRVKVSMVPEQYFYVKHSFLLLVFWWLNSNHGFI